MLRTTASLYLSIRLAPPDRHRHYFPAGWRTRPFERADRALRQFSRFPRWMALLNHRAENCQSLFLKILKTSDKKGILIFEHWKNEQKKSPPKEGLMIEGSLVFFALK